MLAHNLGMDVIAEGVETKEQLKVLRDLRCEAGQGYFFSRPLGNYDAHKFLEELGKKPAASSSREIALRTMTPEDKSLTLAPQEIEV